MLSDLSFYKNRKVMVTGHTGFKGSWLAFWLQQLGARVLGYALPPVNERTHFSLLGLGEYIDHVEGNLLDFELLKSTFERFQPEIVVHLAAQALVRKSYREPKSTFETNVGGSLNLLECVRQSPCVRSLVYITSDKCYLNREWEWGYRENDALGGPDPYSASKAAAENLFYAYAQSYFQARPNFGSASARAGNVVGGGDWSEDRIVPDCIRQLERKQPIVLRNPKSTRPWQHVLDPVYAYLLLGMRLYQSPKEFSGSYNFGPNESSFKTVCDLAERIIQHWGSGSIEIQNGDGLHEANLLHLNCDRAKQVLRWRPVLEFDETLKRTTEWYIGAIKHQNITAITSSQIASFVERAHG